jgi:isoleucyl-tRNA synthetase
VFQFTLDETSIDVKRDEVEILSEEIGAWSVAQEGGVTVALDVQIDDELRAQGHAREVVNRIQGMRKSADLELTDRIQVEYQASPALAKSIAGNHEFIGRETLAQALLEVAKPGGDWVERFEIGDEWIVVGMRRCAV